MQVTKIHMVYGPSGAGKTTFSIKLAAECKGLHFAIDRWMQDLFGDDLPEPLSFEWLSARVRRCEERIWALAKTLVSLEVDVVLDLGFMTRADRARFEGYAKNAGFELERHYLTATKKVRRERVLRRNQEQGETYSVTVSPNMFEFADSRFEPPTPTEQALARCHET